MAEENSVVSEQQVNPAPRVAEAAPSDPNTIEDSVNKKKNEQAFKLPPSKKLCVATTSSADDDDKNKLEVRLGGILCCTVCLDLPKTTVYQCSNGHLMCAGCFNHVMADARIKDDAPTCPNCRVELSRSVCTRNLAVEKAVSELPAECAHCGENFSRNSLDNHEAKLCPNRPATCQYSIIGCSWNGHEKDLTEHEAECKQPTLPGSEILPHVRRQAETADKETVKFEKYMSLLSLEKITFTDLQLRPYRTEEYCNRLYYESTRFSAFGCMFSVNMRLNDDRRDIHLLSERYLSYQVVLRSKPATPRFIIIHTVVRGPYGNMKVNPHIVHHEFTEHVTEGIWTKLPLTDKAECNRLLANRNMDFRIILGQQPVTDF
uniref:Cysteine and histidine-rich protein 1 homolog n=1 Tax=Hirondellea gigas TaxID=1518452 RepID=A0A2P2HXU1_9CRUS